MHDIERESSHSCHAVPAEPKGMDVSQIKDQVTVRLTQKDKEALLVVMQHDGVMQVSTALKGAVHRNANVIRNYMKGKERS